MSGCSGHSWGLPDPPLSLPSLSRLPWPPEPPASEALEPREVYSLHGLVVAQLGVSEDFADF